MNGTGNKTRGDVHTHILPHNRGFELMWLSFEGISSKKPVHTHQLPEAAQSDKMLLWGKGLTLNISLFQV